MGKGREVVDEKGMRGVMMSLRVGRGGIGIVLDWRDRRCRGDGDRRVWLVSRGLVGRGVRGVGP